MSVAFNIASCNGVICGAAGNYGFFGGSAAAAAAAAACGKCHALELQCMYNCMPCVIFCQGWLQTLQCMLTSTHRQPAVATTLPRCRWKQLLWLRRKRCCSCSSGFKRKYAPSPPAHLTCDVHLQAACFIIEHMSVKTT